MRRSPSPLKFNAQHLFFGVVMDHHVKEFFSLSRDETPKGNFHKVISLNKDQKMEWDSIVKLVPKISRGWYELAHLTVEDRIEFTCDYWCSKLPYHPKINEFLSRFFTSLDDIIVFITQKKFADPFEAHLVYSIKGDKGFFRGSLPATDDEIVKLQSDFPGIIFPEDYLAFLRIHNGFCKATDCTGITSSNDMKESFDRFQAILAQENSITTDKGASVDPSRLIPFYESFGMPFFQCFWADWYPEQEMGNVYYSGETKRITDIAQGISSAESMSFPTFTDWLIFYLELIT